jgi:hypothetical protein
LTNSIKIVYDDYSEYADTLKSASEKSHLRPSDLLRIANHIEASFSGAEHSARAYQGTIWLQLFGQYDLINEKNLWTTMIMSNPIESELFFTDSHISSSLAPVSVSHTNCLLVSQKMELQKKIVDFRELEECWDSYDAIKIDETAINRSLEMVSSLFSSFRNKNISAISFFAAPLSDGGIQIEIDSRDVALEIEIKPGTEGTVSYYAEWLGKQHLRGYIGGPFISTDNVDSIFFPSK